MGLWPNFRSPLIWDVFAVSTYATVSILFWFVGLIPDLATLRDRRSQARAVSSTASSRWAGAARRRHWHNYEAAYLLLAGLSTPLVLSVHTVVSLRLRRPASFPAGTPRSSRPTSWPARSSPASRWCSRCAIPLRRAFGLKDFITERHLDNMAKVMLATGLIVAYGYVDRVLHRLVQRQSVRGVHDHQPDHRTVRAGRWSMLILCNVLAPQAAVDPSGAHHRQSVLWIVCDVRQRRHVARAVRDHRHQPAPRLPAVARGACYSPTVWDWS